jgi:hypothetical protein
MFSSNLEKITRRPDVIFVSEFLGYQGREQNTVYILNTWKVKWDTFICAYIYIYDELCLQGLFLDIKECPLLQHLQLLSYLRHRRNLNKGFLIFYNIWKYIVNFKSVGLVLWKVVPANANIGFLKDLTNVNNIKDSVSLSGHLGNLGELG